MKNIGLLIGSCELLRVLPPRKRYNPSPLVSPLPLVGKYSQCYVKLKKSFCCDYYRYILKQRAIHRCQCFHYILKFYKSACIPMPYYGYQHTPATTTRTRGGAARVSSYVSMQGAAKSVKMSAGECCVVRG